MLKVVCALLFVAYWVGFSYALHWFIVDSKGEIPITIRQIAIWTLIALAWPLWVLLALVILIIDRLLDEGIE